MLYLGIKLGQQIKIGEVTLTLTRIDRDVCRIGLDAPREIPILREELLGRYPHAENPRQSDKKDGST